MRQFLRRLHYLLHRRRFDRELQTDMEFHREMAARHGASHFGNTLLLREQARDAWGWTWIERLGQDFHYAVRILGGSPTFTVAAILSLALAIGANTAVFSLINAVLLRTLPVDRPDELTAIAINDNDSLTYPIWDQVRHRDLAFPAAAHSTDRFNLSPAGEVDAVPGIWVSLEFFRVLGVRPHVGRFYDDNNTTVAVLSYDFWTRRYGASPDALGQTIRVEGQPFQIVGVTPPGFSGVTVGHTFDVALPLACEPLVYRTSSKLTQRNHWWLSGIARIPAAARAQALARLNALAPEIMAATAPEWDPDYRKNRFALQPAAVGDSSFRSTYRQSLWILMGVVSVVLLIACANLATLLLARTSARQREIAVRLALGAERSRLVRQLLTESLLLAAAGAALGIAFAWWGDRLLVRLLSTANSSVFLNLTPDFRIVAFTIVVTALTTLFFGLAPALRSTSPPLTSALRNRGAAAGRLTLDRALVAAQIALSLVLLAGGGLFLTSFYKLANVSRGFDASNVLIANLDTRKLDRTPQQRNLLYAEILERLRSTPGIRSAAAVDIAPVTGSSWRVELEIPGSTLSDKERLIYANRVSSGFFATLRIPLLAGRDFTANDTLTSPGVAILSQTAAQRLFPGDNPLGRAVRPTFPPDAKPVEIVGIVADSKYRRLNEGTQPILYFAATQDSKPGANVRYAIRYDGSAPKLHEDPAIAITYRQLETQITDSIARERLLATLSAFFGGLALLLAVIGLYGLMSFAVNRRRAEIGIRVALGAPRRNIVSMILRESAIVASIGIVIGTAIAIALTRYIATLLYGITPGNAITYVTAGAILLVVALVATAVPARRAATLDPMSVLREE